MVRYSEVLGSCCGVRIVPLATAVIANLILEKDMACTNVQHSTMDKTGVAASCDHWSRKAHETFAALFFSLLSASTISSASGVSASVALPCNGGFLLPVRSKKMALMVCVLVRLPSQRG